MKKLLLLVLSVVVMGVSSVSMAANLSSKQVDAIVQKLTVLMEKDPVKFVSVVTKFYDAMEKLPAKKQQIFYPLIDKVDSLVDRYNADIEAQQAMEKNKLSEENLKLLQSLIAREATGSSSVAMLEFSDFECPFCKRHYQNKTLKDLSKIFEGKLSKAYLHFPLSFHPMAMPTALASECVKQQGGNNAYYQFIDKVFAATGSLTTTSLETVVKSFTNLDMTKYNSCVSDVATADFIKKQMDFGSRVFNVTGTPSTVIIDMKTGIFETVSGAVPVEVIRASLSKILK